MQTITQWVGFVCLIGGLVNSHSLANDIDHLNYVDWTLPREVSVSPYEGQRYKAMVPDTVDLVEHANHALNMGTRLWVPEWGYELINHIDFQHHPPLLNLGDGGLLCESAKISEALPMLRAMTGSTRDIQMDAQGIMSFVRVTGKDGLCYYPVESRPWAFMVRLHRSAIMIYMIRKGNGGNLSDLHRRILPDGWEHLVPIDWKGDLQGVLPGTGGVSLSLWRYD